MKSFIWQWIRFITPILLFIVVSATLPATPRSSRSLLFANIDKDRLLSRVSSPRIIFVGGSNVNFGLNSQAIKNATRLNPINTGLHLGLGIQFMLKNTLQYVKRGDIIVLIPEYHHFFNDYDTGSPELIRTVLEVDPSKLKLLSLRQIWNLLPHLPKYAFSKLKPTEYFNITDSDVYSVDSFKDFGDTNAHWLLGKRQFRPHEPYNGSLNRAVIEGIRWFQAEINAKGALLLVSYPSLQLASYKNLGQIIKQIESEYVQNGFKILGSPERYTFPDTMMFDTPYHLNRYGVDIRTTLFVNDLKEYAAKHGMCGGPVVTGNAMLCALNSHTTR